VGDVISLVEGDFLQHISQLEWVSFCFLDAEKDVYHDCYEAVVPHLVSGGLLVADNVVSHQSELQTFVDEALSDPRVDALVVPIGKGELVCRKK
jgi:predicted O-methyltransferase YrrM